MKKISSIILIVMLSMLTVGRSEVIPPPCPTPELVTPEFAVDPNIGRILGQMVTYAGTPMSDVITGCDPDGDSLHLVLGPLPLGVTFDPNNWQLNYNPDLSLPNVVYTLKFELYDQPSDPNGPLMDSATYLFIRRENRKPTLGCRSQMQ